MSSESARFDADSFRLLVETVRDYAIFMLDPDGYIMSWNRGAQRIKGYEVNEIVGQHFSVFYPPDDASAGKPAAKLAEALREGVSRDEGWRLRKDGTRFWADVTIAALYTSAGEHRGYAKVTRDMSEKRRAEEAIRQLNADLEKRVEERTAELARAVHARDEFLSMASHELKTPLTALDFQIRILRDLLRNRGLGGLSAEALQNKLEALERQSARLNSLIDSMLDVTRITSGRMMLSLETFDLSLLVREVLERSHEMIARSGSHIDLITSRGARGSWDRLRIDTVVTNLVSNAVKYGKGNPITIEIMGEDAVARLRVTDQGIGIPADQQQKIFERFERAVPDWRYGGFGIGLWVVHQVVEAHGGEIRISSREGEGSTFEVILPTGQDAAAVGDERPAKGAA